ncbi:peptide-methionine (R)-S-oxide reductase MsrB [soil metagenome]
MDRRLLLKCLSSLTMFPVARAVADDKRSAAPSIKTKAEWAALLSPAAYRVLFESATEHPDSSPLNLEKREGTYICMACYLPLFDSAQKFDSGTGWPSFWRPLPGAVLTEADNNPVYPRIEYHCARCGGHHGHLFDDGPPPTGMRYCNNGVALQFVPRANSLPPLRA